MWTYFLGPILVLLPRRWRDAMYVESPVRMARAALISGLLESLISLLALIGWYLVYFAWLLERFAQHPGPFNWDAVTMAGLFSFALHPLTWTVVYFGFEGAFRTLAAISSQEVYGTLPLYVAEYVYRRGTRPRARPELPLVPDEITPGSGDCDLKIASCRPKSEWKYPFTIRYAGAFFQVIGDVYLGVGPRPYVYSLRRLPQGEIAGGLKEYDPGDIFVQ